MNTDNSQTYEGYTCEATVNLVLLSMTFTATSVCSLQCVGTDTTGRQQMQCVGDIEHTGRRVEIAWTNTPQRGVCSIVEAEVYDGDTCIGHAKRLETCPAHVRNAVKVEGWEHVSEEWSLLPGAGFLNGGLLLAAYHSGEKSGPGLLIEFGNTTAVTQTWRGVMRQRVDFNTRSPDLGTRMFTFAKRRLRHPPTKGATKIKPGSIPLIDPPLVGYVGDVRSVSA